MFWGEGGGYMQHVSVLLGCSQELQEFDKNYDHSSLKRSLKVLPYIMLPTGKTKGKNESNSKNTTFVERLTFQIRKTKSF